MFSAMRAQQGGSRSRSELEGLRARLGDYMNRKGLRKTTQRQLIAETFFNGPDHITVDDLLARVRATDPRVGYATVYRTVKLLTECGVAAERDFGRGRSCYEVTGEAATEHHDHLICLDCGAIIEFHDARIERIQADVAAKLDFHIESHKHEIYGLCSRCASAAAQHRG